MLDLFVRDAASGEKILAVIEAAASDWPCSVHCGKSGWLVSYSLDQCGYSAAAKPTGVLVGKIDVPVFELPHVVVTKDNAKEALANGADRLALLK